MEDEHGPVYLTVQVTRREVTLEGHPSPIVAEVWTGWSRST